MSKGFRTLVGLFACDCLFRVIPSLHLGAQPGSCVVVLRCFCYESTEEVGCCFGGSVCLFFWDPMCLFMYLFCYCPGELLLLSGMLNSELVN